MTFIVVPKTKKEEKIVKAFLETLSIGFHTEKDEDLALLKAMEKGRKSKLLTAVEKNNFLNKIRRAK